MEERNKMTPTVYGIGYLGIGNYKSGLRIDGQAWNTLQYRCWHSMLKRCYGTKDKVNKWYKNIKVCDEWLNFQNFAKWYDENYYNVNNEIMNLDKDILFKGNKIYSPTTCIFVPQSMNKIFTKRENQRGCFPIGVALDIRVNKYQVHMGSKTIAVKDTIEDAFQCYKDAKERYIKQIAEQYKDKIPNKLYNALLNYKVEITD